MALIRYPGHHPKNVNREAKYSVKLGGDAGGRVQLVYGFESGSRALLSTEDHRDLVDMVNKVKQQAQGQAGGAFYINEYSHVVVPTSKGYFFAGTYTPLLTFEFDGDTISADGDGFQPGDTWSGPRVGIPYTLAAGGRDVYYKHEARPGIEKKVTLSDSVGQTRAAHLAQRLARWKGDRGGRIYINEAQALFAPIENGGGWEAIYLGSLGAADWFPEPDVS